MFAVLLFLWRNGNKMHMLVEIELIGLYFSVTEEQ